MAYRLSYRAFEGQRHTLVNLGFEQLFRLQELGRWLLIIITTALFGLIFALLRWRTGSILGAILVHGLMDFAGTLLLPNTDVLSLGRPNIAHLSWMIFGLVLIIAPPIYLWLLHPRVNRSFPQ